MRRNSLILAAASLALCVTLTSCDKISSLFSGDKDRQEEVNPTDKRKKRKKRKKPQESTTEVVQAEEAAPEEIIDSQQFTEFLVVKDEKTADVKTAEEIQQSETVVGHTDFDQAPDQLDIGAREHKEESLVDERPADDNRIFTSVEQMPQFPGGEAELLKWIGTHIKYPTVAMENNIQGRVVVQFVVTKDGSIGEVKVARSKDPDLDKEAVRVVKSLPRFNPGRMDGKPVNVWYTLPVNFRLTSVND